MVGKNIMIYFVLQIYMHGGHGSGHGGGHGGGHGLGHGGAGGHGGGHGLGHGGGHGLGHAGSHGRNHGGGHGGGHGLGHGGGHGLGHGVPHGPDGLTNGERAALAADAGYTPRQMANMGMGPSGLAAAQQMQNAPNAAANMAAQQMAAAGWTPAVQAAAAQAAAAQQMAAGRGLGGYSPGGAAANSARQMAAGGGPGGYTPGGAAENAARQMAAAGGSPVAQAAAAQQAAAAAAGTPAAQAARQMAAAGGTPAAQAAAARRAAAENPAEQAAKQTAAAGGTPAQQAAAANMATDSSPAAQQAAQQMAAAGGTPAQQVAAARQAGAAQQFANQARQGANAADAGYSPEQMANAGMTPSAVASGQARQMQNAARRHANNAAAGITPEQSAMGVTPAGVAAQRQMFNALNGHPNLNAMGAPNSPLSATSNSMHNPLDAAAHEMGPYGSQSPLAQNMRENNDATLQQRMAESMDTVHDDKLKANAAQQEAMKNAMLAKEQQMIQNIKDNIKNNASDAAQKDAQAAATQAAEVASMAPLGDLNQVIPGTNMTYGQKVDELNEIAEHARAHARNPDLYELEHAADEVGSPRPTFGKEILDNAKRNTLREQAKAGQAVLAEAQRRRENRKIAQQALADVIKAEKDLENAKATENDMVPIPKVNQVANALENLNKAKADAQRSMEAIVAQEELQRRQDAGENLASTPESIIVAPPPVPVVDITALQEQAAANELEKNDVVAKVAENISKAQDAGDAFNKELANQDLADAANLSENLNAIKEAGNALNKVANEEALADEANLNENINAIKNAVEEAGKALDQNKNAEKIADEANLSENVAAIEKAVKESEDERAEKITAIQNAAEETLDANKIINQEAFGKDLAKESEKIADMQNERIEELTALKELHKKDLRKILNKNEEEKAALKNARQESIEEIKNNVKDSVNSIKEKLINEQAQKDASNAILSNLTANENINDQKCKTDDPYSITAIIPDNADTVTLDDASIDFPLKTFNPTQAHTQAEAGALYAQNKVKEDIRSTVTAEKFDTPLNVIKGDDGYLNVPESAEKVKVKSGRAYFPEAAVEAMKKAGQDVGHLEHKINTGERNDMGKGLGYYIADISDMELELPSPSNPSPPLVMTGGGKTYDLSKAEGIDIENGELKLEKWEDYARKVRPQFNAGIISDGMGVLNAPGFENEDRAENILNNLNNEAVTNLDTGETLIKVTPPYGVSERVPIQEAVAILEGENDLFNTTQNGQNGIGTSSDNKIGSKETQDLGNVSNGTLNIASDDMIDLTKDNTMSEQSLTNDALEQASGQSKTHKILKKLNAFDNTEHKDKANIINSGAETIAEELGVSKEEIETKGTINEMIQKEKEELKKSTEGKEEVLLDQMQTTNEEQKQKNAVKQISSSIKESLIKQADSVSNELQMSKDDYLRSVSKVSLDTISAFYEYFTRSNDLKALKHYESAKNEIRVLFGFHTEEFIKILTQVFTNSTGIIDPDQQVIIKKTTHYQPLGCRQVSTQCKNGAKKTIIAKECVPVANVIKIPINTIVNKEKKIINNGAVNDGSTGQELLNTLTIHGYPIAKNNVSTPGDPIINFNVQNGDGKICQPPASPTQLPITPYKHSLGSNAIIMGTTKDIRNRVDDASIGGILNVRTIPKSPLPKKQNNKQKKNDEAPIVRSVPIANTLTSVTFSKIISDSGQCKGSRCKDQINTQPSKKWIRSVKFAKKNRTMTKSTHKQSASTKQSATNSKSGGLYFSQKLK